MTETTTTSSEGRPALPVVMRSRGRRHGLALLAVLAMVLAGTTPGAGAARGAASPAPSLVERGVVPDGLRPTFDAATRVPVPHAEAAFPAAQASASQASAAQASAAEAVPAPPVTPRLALPSPWPAVEVRTLLVGLHLLGLCFGLGGATMLDFWLLRWMRWGYLPDNVVRTFEFVGKAVSAGLVLLWLSGCGFLALYALYDPAKLANPKIVAKLVIVGALSVNGLVIHRLVLPYVALARAAPLFDGVRRRRRLLFVLSGALSGVSWYVAFALGLLREFNGRVPAVTLLGIWLTLVLLVVAGTEAVLLLAPALRPRAAAGGKLSA